MQSSILGFGKSVPCFIKEYLVRIRTFDIAKGREPNYQNPILSILESRIGYICSHCFCDNFGFTDCRCTHRWLFERFCVSISSTRSKNASTGGSITVPYSSHFVRNTKPNRVAVLEARSSSSSSAIRMLMPFSPLLPYGPLYVHILRRLLANPGLSHVLYQVYRDL